MEVCFISNDQGRWFKIPAKERSNFRKLTDAGKEDKIWKLYGDYEISDPSDYIVEDMK